MLTVPAEGHTTQERGMFSLCVAFYSFLFYELMCMLVQLLAPFVFNSITFVFFLIIVQVQEISWCYSLVHLTKTDTQVKA